MRHDARCSHVALVTETDLTAQSPATAPIAQIGIVPVSDRSNSPESIRRWQPFIAEAARRFAIPQAWISAVTRAESGGRTTLRGTPITSRAGAMGLMQVMPETYQEMRQRYGLGGNPYDPHDNILAGAAYLRQLLEQFGYPQLFAAYNAGQGRFAAYLRGVETLPAETWAYLSTIGPELARAVEALSPTGTTTPVKPLARNRIPSGAGLFFPVGMHSAVFANLSAMVPPESASNRDLLPPPGDTGALFVPLGAAPFATTGRDSKP
jgi:soluble lytic murein transglycosylase-like protein